jgi:transposase
MICVFLHRSERIRMTQHLTDATFSNLYNYLQHERGIHISDEAKVRQFLEAIYWLCRSGTQWRFLPKEYGNWNSVYKRYERWSALGVWKRMFHYFSSDADLEWLMIDSTIVRAHACASGGKGGARCRRSEGLKAVTAAKFTSA